ncbi:MAG: hypothetical protein H6898_03670 [Rhodobacter sp.]|nr:hypothetical protein [Paracoccaceae bacterium]MCC0075665.1 hypothetical protein [Rhodobacter sp.]
MRFSLACAFALSVTASTVLAQIPYSWSYNRLIAPSPLETVIALSFGVPETDQQQASIQCSIGANWIYADVRLEAEVGGLVDGAVIPVTVMGDGYSEVFEANVERREEGITGVVFAVGLDEPFWLAAVRSSELYYALPGGVETPLLLPGFSPLMGAFLNDCRSIADLRPAPTKAGSVK